MKAVFSLLVLVLAIAGVSSVADSLNVQPLHYNLTFSIDPDKKTITGESVIRIQPLVPIRANGIIELDNQVSTITKCEVWQKNTNKLVHCKNKNKKLTITVPLEFFTTLQYDIKLRFSRTFNEVPSSAIFMTSYNGQSPLITTRFNTNMAHKVFPCFNDPSLLTTFSITINNTAGWEAYSNMPRNKTSSNTVFHTSPPIPTSSVMFFLAKDYVVDSQTIDNQTTVQTHVPKGAAVRVQANSILWSALHGKYFDDYAKKSGLNEIKAVMVPSLREKSITSYGVIAMRPELMKAQLDMTTLEESEVTLSVLNAIAKLYFGNVVVPKAPRDSWLSNSLAIFLQFKAMRNLSSWGDRFINNLEYVTMSSALRKGPISIQEKDVDKSFEMTGVNGAGFIRMLDDLDQADFEGFLRNVFFLNNTHKPVTTENFLSMLANHLKNTGLTETDLARWVYAEDYPVLNVAFVPNDTKVKIEVKWTVNASVPVTFITNKNPENSETQCIVSDYMINDDTKWVVVNSNGKGLYNVVYDSGLYEHLRAVMLMSDAKYAIQRSVLLSSAFYAGRKEFTDYYHALNMTENMINEKDYAPWAVFTRNIIELRNLLIEEDVYKGFVTQLLTLVDKQYDDLETKVVNTNDYYENIMRGLITELACETGQENCQKDTKNQFELIEKMSAIAYQNYLNTYGGDTLPTIHCTGVRSMNSTSWNAYMKKVYKLDDPENLRERALLSLACGKKDVINQLLQLTIRPKQIHNDDKFKVLRAIYKQPENVNATLNRLSMWAKHKPKLFTKEWAEVFDGIAPMLYSPKQRDLINQIKMDIGTEDKTLLESIEHASDAAQHNFEFIMNSRSSIKEWVDNFQPVPPPPSMRKASAVGSRGKQQIVNQPIAN